MTNEQTGQNFWICGGTRSGKTTQLMAQFGRWAEAFWPVLGKVPPKPMLIFAATGDTRMALVDQLTVAPNPAYPFDSATPLGFFQDEVILFYPLLVEVLEIPARFPLRLRPETEQELATRLWQEDLDSGRLHLEGLAPYYLVRRILDAMQLAASGGVPIEEIPLRLQAGMPEFQGSAELWEAMGQAQQRWRAWCLERGLLTYSLVTELYWRYLLPHPTYRAQLTQRYQAVLADDVDEYPAIAQTLFSTLLEAGIPGCFSYNPDGAIRQGLGADPEALAHLQDHCTLIPLETPADNLGHTWAEPLVQWIREPILMPPMPDTVQTLQTVARGQLLRRTAEAVMAAIQQHHVPPGEIAIIGPGVDAIARYTLREILTRQNIPVEALNEQQPLVGSPMIRALLTLLALVYPGLGRLLEGGAIAELLITLSQPTQVTPQPSILDQSAIDPVRAGLLVDHCFVPDLERPRLLAATAFPRWDRLGYRATDAYETIRRWIDEQQQQQQQRLLPNPITLLDRAIQRFFLGGSHLPYDRLAALREFMETAQHYWEVDNRLYQAETPAAPRRPRPDMSQTVGRFIELLRNGTLTADPYPTRPTGDRQAVVLATIYQYRAARGVHRWQFWLDAGSPLWLTGSSDLFSAPLMLRGWNGHPWTAADAFLADQHRLERQVRDLLGRAQDRVILCHSDLATMGQEQTGPLLSLVNAASPLESVEGVEISVD